MRQQSTSSRRNICTAKSAPRNAKPAFASFVGRVAETIRDWDCPKATCTPRKTAPLLHDELVHLLLRQYATPARGSTSAAIASSPTLTARTGTGIPPRPRRIRRHRIHQAAVLGGFHQFSARPHLTRFPTLAKHRKACSSSGDQALAPIFSVARKGL